MAAENAGAPFANDRRYPARKRRAPGGSNEEVIDKVLRAAESASKIIVFTGSGLSASSGKRHALRSHDPCAQACCI